MARVYICTVVKRLLRMVIAEESRRTAIEFAAADVRRPPRAKGFDKNFIFARVNCLVAVGCA